MCRIGAIKSKVPVEPAKALYLMLPQQEGHDNSGYAMVMQDLYGVFEGHKDKPLLSLACTPRGVRMVDAYMAEQGFEQVLEWLPDVDRRPGLDIKAMPCYVFRNYEYPEAYRGRPQAEREELLLDTRLALRRMLEKDGQGFVYSFWPDVLTLKEIGDPRDIAAYFRLWDEEGPLRAKSIVTQCRQNTNYDIVRYAAHPFFLQGYTLCANGENTFYTKNTEYQKSLHRGYVGFESDSQNFLYTLHYVLRELKWPLKYCKHVITPLPFAEAERRGDRKVLKGYNDLRTTHPKIAREWKKERNGDLKPTDAIANSNKRVWWKCEEGHEWSGLIANRARKGKADPGCPYCSGRKVLAGYNDLATTHPGIAAMWHPRMNKRLKPTGVQAVSRKLAWWRGECGHVYQMSVRDRVGAKPGYCPYCSGRKRPERPIRLD